MSTVPKVVRYEKVGSVMTLRLSDGREFSFDAESMAKLIQEGVPEESGFNDEARQVTQDIIDEEARQEVLDDEAREIEQEIIDEEEHG